MPAGAWHPACRTHGCRGASATIFTTQITAAKNRAVLPGCPCSLLACARQVVSPLSSTLALCGSSRPIKCRSSTGFFHALAASQDSVASSPRFSRPALAGHHLTRRSRHARGLSGSRSCSASARGCQHLRAETAAARVGSRQPTRCPTRARTPQVGHSQNAHP